MTNFLTTYLLHSTVLLVAMWLVLRMAHPRSPVLVERLWKLVAVLPIMTALLMNIRPVPDQPELPTTSGSSDVGERLDEASSNESPRDSSESAVPISYDDSSFARMTEPLAENDPPSDFPLTYDPSIDPLPNSVVIELPAERSTGALAHPIDDEPIADGTGNPPKADHPPAFDLITEAVPSETVAVESDELVSTEAVVSPLMIASLDVPAPAVSAASWQLPAWRVGSALLLIWMAFGAAWLVIRSAWFRWRLRESRHVDRGRAVGLLRELMPQTQRIRLLIVPGFAEPAAFGIWRPTIVLPPSCESLDREALRAVLAHELGHIARGDLYWLAIGRVLTTVFGFQPLNRIARREWTRAAECLCDDWAVGRGVERLTLARCLTALAEHRLTGVSLADALAAVGSPSSLRQRVERLVAEPIVDPWSQRSRRWLVSGSVLALGVLIASLLPLPEVLTASVPSASGGSGSGLDDADVTQSETLPDGRSTEVDTELVADIEAELSALRTELQHAARLAEQRNDPFWIDAAESLREREQHLVERWRRWKSE
ncbi:MAG: M56 family metallopeptidase [Planctomycetaceae bacterium]|nr:M56 family metallopeptidase [Planctomycetaceae bacterium]